jgi:RHS repeat-associated protein
MFCLDGKRLVAVNGDYGAEGTEYRTEVDTFTRVISHTRLFDVIGPDYFEARTKDGQIMLYGNTDQASVYAEIPGQSSVNAQKRAWNLSRVSDAGGNYFDVHYEHLEVSSAAVCDSSGPLRRRCASEEVWPISIAYGGFDDGTVTYPPDREVEFVYSRDRADRIRGYAEQRVPMQRTRLLKEISTWTSGQRVRRYKLEYETGVSGVSRLHTVSECADAGSADPICKPPTTFSYTEGTSGFQEPEAFGGQVIYTNSPMSVLDANGDGIDDLLILYPMDPSLNAGLDEEGYGVILSQKFAPRTHVFAGSTLTRSSTRGFPFGVWMFWSNYVIAGTPSDIDGNGRDDVPELYISGGGNTTGSNNQTAGAGYLGFNPSNGGLTVGYGTRSLGGYAETPIVPVRAFAVDVNRDGVTDGLLELDSAEHLDLFRHLGWEPGVTGPESIFKLAAADGINAESMLFDKEGDGFLDLLQYSTTNQAWGALELTENSSGAPFWSWASPVGDKPYLTASGNPKHLKAIDLNADGAPDLLELWNPGSTDPILALRAFISQRGPAFEMDWPFKQGEADFTWDETNFPASVVIDYDGDGREDLLSPRADTPTTGIWEVFRNMPPDDFWVTDRLRHVGTVQFPRPPMVETEPEQTLPFQEPVMTPTYLSAVGDFDGDGRDDVVSLNSAGKPEIMYGAGTRGDLLFRIEDGVGKVVTIDYFNRDSNGNYTYKSYFDVVPNATCEAPLKCLKKMGPLVSGHRVSQMQFGVQKPERQYEYHYQDARESTLGHGFLGMGGKEVVERDGSGELIRTTALTYENQFYDSELNLFPTAGRLTQVIDTTVPESSAPLSPTTTARRTTTGNFYVRLTSDAGQPFVHLASIGTTVEEVDDGGTATPVYATATANIAAEVDPYGNSKERFVATGTANGSQLVTMSTTTISTIYDLVSSRIDAWQTGLPLRVTTTNTRGGETKTRVTEFTHDGAGRLATTTQEPSDPNRRLLRNITRTPTGNVESVSLEDSLGEVRNVTVAHDVADRFPITITDGLQHVSQVRVDANTGQISTAADPNGIVEQWAYDGFGRLGTHVGPGIQEQIDYQEAGPDFSGPIRTVAHTRVEVTRQGGPRTQRDLDSFGRVVRTSTTGFGGEVIQEFEYNASGNLGRQSRPHLGGDESQGIVNFFYDKRLRLITQVDPDNRSVTHSYGTAALLDSNYASILSTPEIADVVLRSDRKGHTTGTGVDPYGNPMSSMDELLAITKYAYGAFNGLSSITDPAGNVLSATHDQLGRVTSYDDPSTGHHDYTHTAFGEIKTHVDGNGSRSFLYDVIGRQRVVNDNDGTTQFRYDGDGPNEIGRLVEATAPDGHVTTLGYEPPTSTTNRGFLTRMSDTFPSSSETLDVGFDYDEFGRVGTVTYPTAGGQSFSVVNEYDNASGSLLNVRNPTTSERYWHLVSAYQGLRPDHEELGNGLEVARQYEALTGHLLGIQTTATSDHSMRQNVGYHYDGNGNVDVLLDQAQTGVPLEVLGYDEMDRLTSRTIGYATGGSPTTTETFGYDGVGNITNTTKLGDYHYDLLPNQVSSAGGNTYTYDPVGNLATRSGPDVPSGGQTFTYTAFNLPKSIVPSSGGETDLSYDAFQRRVIKTTPAGRTLYVSGLYEKRTTTSGTTHLYRVFAGGREITNVTRTEMAGSVDPASDRTVYLHSDALGSPSVITNSSGASTLVQGFHPFGLSENETGESDVTTGFTGHQHDPEVGLIDMKGRLYDPIIGRFTTPDPIMQDPSRSRGLNRYSYAWNNPLKWVDPSGFDNIVGADGAGYTPTSDGTITFRPTDTINPGANTANTTAPPVTTPAPLPPPPQIYEPPTSSLFEAPTPSFITQQFPTTNIKLDFGGSQSDWSTTSTSNVPAMVATQPPHDQRVIDTIEAYRNASRGSSPSGTGYGQDYDAWDRAREDYRMVNLWQTHYVVDRIALRDAEHFLLRQWITSAPDKTFSIPYGNPAAYPATPDPWQMSLTRVRVNDYIYGPMIRPFAELFIPIAPTTWSMFQWEQRGYDYGANAGGWHFVRWEYGPEAAEGTPTVIPDFGYH